MAATRQTALGTDVVILDANSGHELMRVTDDDASWAPVWSPAGDGIAFLHIVGQTVDLRLARLEGDARCLDDPRDDRPDRGLRARCRVATRLVHPAGAAARPADAATLGRRAVGRGASPAASSPAP